MNIFILYFDTVHVLVLVDGLWDVLVVPTVQEENGRRQGLEQCFHLRVYDMAGTGHCIPVRSVENRSSSVSLPASDVYLRTHFLAGMNTCERWWALHRLLVEADRLASIRDPWCSQGIFESIPVIQKWEGIHLDLASCILCRSRLPKGQMKRSAWKVPYLQNTGWYLDFLCEFGVFQKVNDVLAAGWVAHQEILRVAEFLL